MKPPPYSDTSSAIGVRPSVLSAAVAASCKSSSAARFPPMCTTKSAVYGSVGVPDGRHDRLKGNVPVRTEADSDDWAFEDSVYVQSTIRVRKEGWGAPCSKRQMPEVARPRHTVRFRGERVVKVDGETVDLTGRRGHELVERSERPPVGKILHLVLRVCRGGAAHEWPGPAATIWSQQRRKYANQHGVPRHDALDETGVQRLFILFFLCFPSSSFLAVLVMPATPRGRGFIRGIFGDLWG